MTAKYSVAIYPSEEIITLVRSMKFQLAEAIGWFHSKNSTAHITVFEFKSPTKEIEIIKKQLTKLSDTLASFNVCFNKFGSYPNGAFYIAPDEDSKKNLKTVMKQFHQSIKIPNSQKSTDPHLSIARKLTSENIEIATSLYSKPSINFNCCEVVLRIFDENIKQFVVTDVFPFKGNEKTSIQGTLF